MDRAVVGRHAIRNVRRETLTVVVFPGQTSAERILGHRVSDVRETGENRRAHRHLVHRVVVGRGRVQSHVVDGRGDQRPSVKEHPDGSDTTAADERASYPHGPVCRTIDREHGAPVVDDDDIQRRSRGRTASPRELRKINTVIA